MDAVGTFSMKNVDFLKHTGVRGSKLLPKIRSRNGFKSTLISFHNTQFSSFNFVDVTFKQNNGYIYADNEFFPNAKLFMIH